MGGWAPQRRTQRAWLRSGSAAPTRWPLPYLQACQPASQKTHPSAPTAELCGVTGGAPDPAVPYLGGHHGQAQAGRRLRQVSDEGLQVGGLDGGGVGEGRPHALEDAQHLRTVGVGGEARHVGEEQQCRRQRQASQLAALPAAASHQRARCSRRSHTSSTLSGGPALSPRQAKHSAWCRPSTCEGSAEGARKVVCPGGSVAQRAACSGGSAARRVACPCSPKPPGILPGPPFSALHAGARTPAPTCTHSSRLSTGSPL